MCKVVIGLGRIASDTFVQASHVLDTRAKPFLIMSPTWQEEASICAHV